VARADPAPSINALLEAVERVLEVERLTDEAQRRVTAEMLRDEHLDARVLHLVAALSGDLEAAADALMHAALSARDAVLGTIMVEQTVP
jgi:hypothetical protein